MSCITRSYFPWRSSPALRKAGKCKDKFPFKVMLKLNSASVNEWNLAATAVSGKGVSEIDTDSFMSFNTTLLKTLNVATKMHSYYNTRLGIKAPQGFVVSKNPFVFVCLTCCNLKPRICLRSYEHNTIGDHTDAPPCTQHTHWGSQLKCYDSARHYINGFTRIQIFTLEQWIFKETLRYLLKYT